MKKITVTVRVSEQTQKNAIAAYGAQVTGLQVACENWFKIREKTLQETILTEEETNTLNSVQIPVLYSARLLLAHLADAQIVVSEELKSKIENLTCAQTYFLTEKMQKNGI